MGFPVYMLFPVYTSVIALVMVVVVPREKIKRLVPFAIIFGGVLDYFWLLLLNLLKAAGYTNLGPWAFSGVPFFPPLAWTFFFIIYLHFLPERYPWNYIFTLAAAVYSVMFSNVLQNLGLFQWRYERFFLPLVVYAIWMITVTYTFQHFFKETKTYT